METSSSLPYLLKCFHDFMIDYRLRSKYTYLKPYIIHLKDFYVKIFVLLHDDFVLCLLPQQQIRELASFGSKGVGETMKT